MALKLGELSAVISADDKPFEQGLSRAKKKFEGFSDKIKAGAALAGAAAGTALAAGIAGAMEIDAANDKLAAQLGLSAEESARMGKIAGDLYANAYGESIGQVNEAIKGVTRNLGDLTDDELKSVTASVLDLSSAFGVDLDAATRATAKLLKTGLAPDATAALDLITRGFQTGTDEAGDLLDTISEYSTKFRDLGLDGQTAMGLLSQGLAAGARDADTVADALKEFSIRAIDGSKATADGFKALGLSGKQMADDIAAGGPRAAAALDQTLDRLRGIKDPVERNAAAVALFGTKAEDLGDALFALDPTSAVQALGDVDGAAKKMGDTLSDNASTKLESFKRKAQQALVEKLAEALPYIEATFGWLKDNSDWVVPLATGLGLFAAAIYTITLAMKAWAAIQVVLNLALWTSPITWIVLGVIALIAVIVLIATKTTWFQDAWNWAWGGIKAAASAVWDWISGTLWPGIKAVWDGIVSGVVWVKDKFVEAWNGIKSYASNVWDYFTGLPGKLKTIFDKVTDFISAPFKAGFNAVSRAWNNTIGKLHWTIPDWVPGIGGNSISAPTLPTFHRGGIVPGPRGSEVLAVLQAGEQVIPAAQVRRGDPAGQTVNVGRLVEFSGPVTVRSDQDIVDLSRGIARETTRRLRALGQQVAVT